MRPDPVPEAHRSQLSDVIARTLGLHFPQERWSDLQRGLEGAAKEWGDADATASAGRLLSKPLTPSQLEVLAGHLTIGETYFFREKKTFAALAQQILPALIQARRGREQRLRIWSAGCCTGEEAYSLAIVVHQLLPDLADWQVTIRATDLNPRFLRKAVAGAYGEWSFRDTPKDLRARYFSPGGNGRHVVVPAIRQMVTFAPLNLATDSYPSPETDTHAMDLIFCRNVLMYFTPAQARNVVGRFHRALVDGGWLAVSPTEASQALFPQFVAESSPDTILYRKDAARPGGGRPPPAAVPEPPPPFFAPVEAPRWQANEEPAAAAQPRRPAPSRPPPPSPEAARASRQLAQALYEQGRYAEVADTLVPSADDAPAFSLLARASANQGLQAEALAWCDRWIVADKLDSGAHYLRAIILLERGEAPQARSSLQRAVYLDPGFILAHFALGNLARGGKRPAEAEKHFGNALQLLARCQPNDVLPASDGLTAGRLAEAIAASAPRQPSR